MLERIIFGVFIGVCSVMFFTKELSFTENNRKIIVGFFALIIIAFVGPSSMFSAAYGVMAVGKIAVGYWLSSSLITQKST
ncbi:hypothetical protein QWY74_01715 [Halomonas almeriensis]|uniref:hypothetical protein n=1 Tax=Halomonas almeriensis TaxID=308163 RepID=UPI0025B53B26|nr:hypothetical protein [Halomonas almeriensis]MDN3552195.1 hypothetical protein [Halomonas almeriensis]